MIDTQRFVETPEGVDLSLTPAGPVARAEAWLIDAVVTYALLLAVSIPLALLGATGTGLYLLAFFVTSWLYFILFEALKGSTPGKRVLHLRVVHDDGTPCGWPAAIVRNLLRAADALPLGYACGLIAMLVSKDFRRLGDLAAGTVVVYAEPAAAGVRVVDAAPLPPPVALRTEERLAIVEFTRRIETLTPERAADLVSLVPALPQGHAGVETMRRYAAWIAGRR